MAHQQKPGRGRIGLPVLDLSRLPDLCPPQRKTLRHDTNECGRLAVEGEALSQNLRVACKSSSPKLVAHDKHRRRSGAGIRWREVAPEKRFYIQELECISGDQAPVQRLRRAGASPKRPVLRSAHRAVEDVVSLLIVQKLRLRKCGPPARLARTRIMDLDQGQPGTVPVRERLEQDVVDHAEDGGRRSNS